MYMSQWGTVLYRTEIQNGPNHKTWTSKGKITKYQNNSVVSIFSLMFIIFFKITNKNQIYISFK